MPLYNFKARFADAVASGAKRQTIRAPRKGGRNPKPGDTLYLYTGLRTKQACKLRVAVARKVRQIVLMERTGSEGTGYRIHLDGRELSELEADELGRRDGFRDLDEFMRWFDGVHGLPFSGLLIEWD